MMITSIFCLSYDLLEFDRTIRPTIVAQSSVRTVSNVQYDHGSGQSSAKAWSNKKFSEMTEDFRRPAWDLTKGYQSCRYCMVDAGSSLLSQIEATEVGEIQGSPRVPAFP